MKILVFDLECYTNVFLVCARDIEQAKDVSFEISDRCDQRSELITWFADLSEASILLGFNNHLYDNLMLDKALDLVYRPKEEFLHSLKQYNDQIFALTSSRNKWEEAFMIKRNALKSFNSIDVYRLSSGVSSLKGAALLMNDPNIQELPIPPYELVPKERLDELRQYCQRDVDITHRLWQKLQEYGAVNARKILCDLGFLSSEGTLKHLSHSDSRLGEEIFGAYAKPNYNRFSLPELESIAEKTKHPDLITYYQRLSEVKFHITDDLEITSRDLWYVNNREHIIRIGQQRLAIREAGIHSQQRLAVAVADEEHAILHIDATSMYPSAIRNFQLLPTDLQEAYQTLIDQKEEAIRQQDYYRASATKVGLNAVSGKFKDKYSNLFDGRARYLQVYSTQAMMVEMLYRLHDRLGIHAFNVNTDGIILHTHRDHLPDIQKIIQDSSRLWNIHWVVQEYRFVYQTHVNEFFAIRHDSTMKTIGSYGRYPYKEFKYYLKQDVGAYLRNFLYDWYHAGFRLASAEWLAESRPPHWFFMDAGAGSKGKGLKVEARSGRYCKILRYYYARSEEEVWYNTTHQTKARVCAEYPIRSCEHYQPEWSQHDLPDIDLNAYQSVLEKAIGQIQWVIRQGWADGRPVTERDLAEKPKRLRKLSVKAFKDALRRGKEFEFFQQRYAKLSQCTSPEPTLRQDIMMVKKILLAKPKSSKAIYYHLHKLLEGKQQLELF